MIVAGCMPARGGNAMDFGQAVKTCFNKYATFTGGGATTPRELLLDAIAVPTA